MNNKTPDSRNNTRIVKMFQNQNRTLCIWYHESILEKKNNINRFIYGCNIHTQQTNRKCAPWKQIQAYIITEKYLIRKILEKGKTLHKTKYKKPEITGEEKLIEHGWLHALLCHSNKVKINAWTLLLRPSWTSWSGGFCGGVSDQQSLVRVRVPAAGSLPCVPQSWRQCLLS